MLITVQFLMGSYTNSMSINRRHQVMMFAKVFRLLIVIQLVPHLVTVFGRLHLTSILIMEARLIVRLRVPILDALVVKSVKHQQHAIR